MHENSGQRRGSARAKTSGIWDPSEIDDQIDPPHQFDDQLGKLMIKLIIDHQIDGGDQIDDQIDAQIDRRGSN